MSILYNIYTFKVVAIVTPMRQIIRNSDYKITNGKRRNWKALKLYAIQVLSITNFIFVNSQNHWRIREQYHNKSWDNFNILYKLYICTPYSVKESDISLPVISQFWPWCSLPNLTRYLLTWTYEKKLLYHFGIFAVTK